MTALVLYDDAAARALEPFALTRPAGELRAGAVLIRQRWERAFGTPATAFAGARHLSTFDEAGAPAAVAGTIAAGSVIANTRFAPALGTAPAGATTWRCDGRVVAVRTSRPIDAGLLGDGSLALESLGTTETAEADGWWIDRTWDLIRHLADMLASDIAALAPGEAGAPPAHLTVLGAHEAFVAPGAHIEPFVLADTTAGPILVRDGARVNAFSRLVGPCVVGTDALVAGGRIATSAIGERVRVHGEVSTSIFIGNANKAHDGFVGHSVIGRWANLGAGTVTSNLKNSYGEVSLWTTEGMRRTGLQFLGTFFGDHVKTGIGTRLTTGTVIGAGANLFGNRMTPKFVPPFAWGDAPPFGEFELERFLQVAERVMKRRDMPLSEGARLALIAAWERRTAFAP